MRIGISRISSIRASFMTLAFLMAKLSLAELSPQSAFQILEEISQADLEQVVRIVNEGYGSGYEKYLVGGYSTSADRMRTTELNHKDARIAVLRNLETNEILATILIRLEEPDSHTIMFHKFVASPKGGKGIGQQLLRFAEKWALKNNPFAHSVRLEAFNQAESLVEYYERNGFHKVRDSSGVVRVRPLPPEDQARATDAYRTKDLAYILMERTRQEIESG